MHYTDKLQLFYTVLDFLQTYGKATRKQLIKRVEEKGYSISTRTFERLKDEMKNSFGLELLYVDKAYTLKTNTNPYQDTLFRLLDLISEMELFQNAIKNPSHSERIVFDEINTPRFYRWLPDLFKAIIERRIVHIHYRFFEKEDRLAFNIHPVLLKEYMRRWYVIAYSPYKSDFRTYGLDRIQESSLLNERFADISHSKIRDQMANYVGLDHSAPVELVTLQVTKRQSKYLDTLPLHESQLLVQENTDFDIYTFKVGINYELIQKILMMGDQVVVIKPSSLVYEIKRTLSTSIKNYQDL